MKKFLLTCISDTHTKHSKVGDLIGGDIILHAGDIMSSGYSTMEVYDFLMWYDKLNQYKNKVFIAGNHDRVFQNNPDKLNEIVNGYKNVNYLMDSSINIDGVKIWGTPWQPWFFNWAFNVTRGEEIKKKWDLIPDDIDILIVHGPPHGILDYVPRSHENVGCEDLTKRILEVKPKIVIFGHIHEGYGYLFKDGVHYINASVLNDRYEVANKPFNFEWIKETNEINFI